MPIDQRISVTPVEGGWQVECALTGQPMMFLSDARAQEMAQALARCVASLGQDARVFVHDRSKALLATTRYFADEPQAADTLASELAAIATIEPSPWSPAEHG